MKILKKGDWIPISVSSISKLINDERYNSEITYDEESVTFTFYRDDEYYPILFTREQYKFFYRMLQLDKIEKRISDKSE